MKIVFFIQDLLEILGPLEDQVRVEHQVFLDPPDPEDLRVNLVNPDLKEHKVPKDPADKLDPEVRMTSFFTTSELSLVTA